VKFVLVKKLLYSIPGFFPKHMREGRELKMSMKRDVLFPL